MSWPCASWSCALAGHAKGGQAKRRFALGPQSLKTSARTLHTYVNPQCNVQVHTYVNPLHTNVDPQCNVQVHTYVYPRHTYANPQCKHHAAHLCQTSVRALHTCVKPQCVVHVQHHTPTLNAPTPRMRTNAHTGETGRSGWTGGWGKQQPSQFCHHLRQRHFRHHQRKRACLHALG